MALGPWVVSSRSKGYVDSVALEEGDFIEATGFSDELEDMGQYVGRVLKSRRDGPHLWVRLDVFCCESDWFAWSINEETNPAWYHVCSGCDRSTCKVAGIKGYTLIDQWRVLPLQALLQPGLDWFLHPYYLFSAMFAEWCFAKGSQWL